MTRHTRQLASSSRIAERWFTAFAAQTGVQSNHALEMVSNLADMFTGAIWIRQNEGRIVYANRSFETVWGRRREELYENANLLAGAIFHEDRSIATYVQPRSIEGDHTFPDHRILLPSGEVRWLCVRSSTYRNEAGDRVLEFFTAEDVTGFRKTVEEMRRSEAEYRTLIETQDQLIVKVDPQHRLLYVSPSYCETFGKQEQELLGSVFMPLVHEDDRESTLKAMERLHCPPHTCYIEQRAMTRSGWRWLAWNDKAIVNERGEIVSIVGVGRDITDRRRHREELAQAMANAERANREKDSFLAMLSHELRTPLTPVLASVSSLELDDALPPELLDSLRMIKRNIELESRLIDDLLDLTRISRGKLRLDPRLVDAHDLLQNAINISWPDVQGKDISFKRELTADKTQIIADPARIQQVFWNLIKNAVQFTQPGGTVAVRTSSDDNYLTVQIIDNGLGIDPEFLSRIFEAFEQEQRSSRRGGLGLGLAISRTVLDLHGGTITAESEGRHRGSRFTVKLPLADVPDGPAIATVKPSLAPRRRSLRVLLVEDHASTLHVLTTLLTKLGHKVTPVMTLADALQKTSEAAAFDLLISDIGLPDGSGLELVKQLRRRRPMPSIALSGFGMDHDVSSSRDAGFTAHLTKPVGMQLLLETIDEVMRGS